LSGAGRYLRADAFFRDDMTRPTLLIALLTGLAACTFEVPDFLGREGGSSDSYGLAREVWPDPVPVGITSARIEPALRGVIVRVDGIAPTDGYHSAELTSLADSPVEALADDRPTSGVIELAFLAIPPAQAEDAGPVPGRVLHAAAFLPARFLEDATAIRVRSGADIRTLPLD
jgi:hypothetical protein